MRRRDVIAGLGTAAALWPLGAVAQTPLPIVGFLNTGSSVSLDDRLEAFRRGLAQGGMVEGRSVVVEPHIAEGDIAKLPGMVADLVRRSPDPGHTVVGLMNHGLTITGESLDEILERVGPHIVRRVPMS